MQPHSISALAVVREVFAINYGIKVPKTGEIRIEFHTVDGRTRSLYHFISQINESKVDINDNILELSVTVKTTDGSPCTIKIERVSSGEYKQGEKFRATHSVQHRAGLEEIYEVSRTSIRGEHRNSYKYGNFASYGGNESAFVLNCMVREGNTDRFKQIPYKVSVKFTY